MTGILVDGAKDDPETPDNGTDDGPTVPLLALSGIVPRDDGEPVLVGTVVGCVP